MKKVRLALLAHRREDGPRTTYAISRQYVAVPLVFACLALIPFIFRDRTLNWVGGSGLALFGAWTLVRLAWVERLTVNRHSGRYRYRRGWWPLAPLRVGALSEIDSVTLDRQELHALAVPVSLSDIVWRYAQIWKSCVWIIGLNFRATGASVSVTNFYDRKNERAARAAAADLAQKIGVPVVDRTGGA